VNAYALVVALSLILPSVEACEASLARRDGMEFACLASRGRYQPARHLDLLWSRLKNLTVFGGNVETLLVWMPPRHSKSTSLSRYLPAWFLGKNPDKSVILAAHTASLANKWGRRVRDTLNDYGPQVFGVRISRDSGAVADWEVERVSSGKAQRCEGGMYSCGVDGALPGRGADLAIVDDPIKTHKQAASITYREAVWEWWESGLMTRLEPGASVVVVMHRWHEDDLCGRILAQAEAEDSDDGRGKVDVLKLPALAEDNDPMGRKPGEALWPERYPAPRLRQRMERVGPYYAASLYQQNPHPREGGVFKVDGFRIIDAVPTDIVRQVRYWDLAATEAKKRSADPDYIAGVKMGIRRDRSIVILDVVRDRREPGGVEKLLKLTASLDGTGVLQKIEQEPGSAGKIVIHNYVTDTLAGHAVKGERSTGSKEVRAEPLASQVAVGNVSLLRAPWNLAFIAECKTFPTGTHDDQVDAASGAYEELSGKRTSGPASIELVGSSAPMRIQGNV
jgi:predicted phage terminase large subunit-like protein